MWKTREYGYVMYEIKVIKFKELQHLILRVLTNFIIHSFRGRLRLNQVLNFKILTCVRRYDMRIGILFFWNYSVYLS